MTFKTRRVKKSDFKHQLFIESFGVKICLTTNEREAVEDFRNILKKYLLDFYKEIEKTESAHQFLYVRNRSQKDTLYRNGEGIFRRLNRESALEYLGSEVRRCVAEFAVGRVFIHSGVVEWRGRVILIPGTSFSGKTTLTAAFVKHGAVYYSDEYAILDEEGFVYPFPKTLSLRTEADRMTQIEHDAKSLGGKIAAGKGRLGLVLITGYSKKGKWKPQLLTPAKGILEIIKHTVPIRTNPNYVIKVLNEAIKGAKIIKSKRGDAAATVELILDDFEQNRL
jgi:hypothetical protein